MQMIPVRLPDSMAEALERVAQREGLDRSTTLRRLLNEGLDRYVAGLYQKGDVTLRETAGWLGVGLREAMDRLADAGAPGNITIEDMRQELEAIDQLSKQGTAETRSRT